MALRNYMYAKHANDTVLNKLADHEVRIYKRPNPAVAHRQAMADIEDCKKCGDCTGKCGNSLSQDIELLHIK